MKVDDCDSAQVTLDSFTPAGTPDSGGAENMPDDKAEMIPVDADEIKSVAVVEDVKCAFCGRLVNDEETYGVDFGNYRLQDGSRCSVELLIPCCASCRERVQEIGVDMASLQKNARIKEVIGHGAYFSVQWHSNQDRIKSEYRMKCEIARSHK